MPGNDSRGNFEHLSETMRRLLATCCTAAALVAPPPRRRTKLRAVNDDAPPAPWEGQGADARKAAMAAVFDAQANLAQQSEADLDPEALKRRETAKFERRRNEVVGDHLFLGSLLIAAGWHFLPIKVLESYGVGVLFGGAYLYLLGRYVGSLGEATLDGAKEGGIGQARFAVVGLLIAIAGKQREYLDFIPLLLGFFSYQLATLLQAARPVDD